MTHMIGFYGTWRASDTSDIYELALSFGAIAAQHGFTVLTGAYSGVMEAAPRGAMQAGGKTVGYSWLKLDNDLDTNRFLGVVTHFPEMEQRLARVVGDAAICVFFPGRTGTVAELALATEMRAKGEKRFPLVLVGDFWNGFFSWLEKSNASLDVPSDEDDLKDILYVRIDDAEAFDRFLEKHRAVLELAE